MKIPKNILNKVERIWVLNDECKELVREIGDWMDENNIEHENHIIFSLWGTIHNEGCSAKLFKQELNRYEKEVENK